MENRISSCKDLATYFKRHLVPQKLYKIGGRHNNRICLAPAGTGWDVYFSEKKDKIGLVHYEDEPSACQGMKNEIRKMMEVMYGMTWIPDRA